MAWLEPVILAGPHAQLEPLSIEHCTGLIEAVQDGHIWKLWYTNVPAPDEMRREIERRIGLQAAGAMLPFAVRDGTGVVAGMTTYMNVDAGNRRVEIGSTWYRKSAQRSTRNASCCCCATRSRRSTALRSNFARMRLILRAAPRSRGSAPGRTASCATIRLRRTARCVTPSYFRLLRASGRPCGRI